MISIKACVSAWSDPLDKDQLKALRKRQLSRARRSRRKNPKPRVFVLDFDGDIKASATEPA